MAKKNAKSKTVEKKASTKTTGEKAQGLAKKEYTEEEKARLAHYRKRCERKPVRVKKVEGGPGQPTIALEDPDDPLASVKMFETMGTPNSDLQSHLLNQAILTFSGYATTGGVDHDRLPTYCNNAIAILNGIQPQDEVEGMLAVQMVGVHNMAMETLKRAMLGDQSLEGKQVNVNQATKMLRTFVAQMEALKKYRTGGQQKMIVEHVHVNEGGQAIVGTVHQGGGKNGKNCE